MQLISAHQGKLRKVLSEFAPVKSGRARLGLQAMDELAPEGGLSTGAVHELLFAPSDPVPAFAAMWIASRTQGAVICSDPARQLYPPALVAMGIPLDRLYLLRPTNREEELWAVTECMRCKGVGAVVASVDRLSRIEARRLQLAVERGGGVGIVIRPKDKRAGIYAAATRWLVAPFPGERTVQRWRMELIHGHGGRVGDAVILEHRRETHLVRAVEELADRPVQTQTEPIRLRA